jgi:hypothetical protein
MFIEERTLESLKKEKDDNDKEFDEVLKELVLFSRYQKAAEALCLNLRYLFDQNAVLNHEIWNRQTQSTQEEII